MVEQQSLIRRLGLLDPLPSSQSTKPKVLGMASPTTPSYAPAPMAPQAPSIDFQSILKQAMETSRQASQPILDSLNQGVGQIQDTFGRERSRLESQRAPLQQRYQNLIADIKGQGQRQAESQTRITNSELGKRGIVGSSTLAQQEIQNATQPIAERTQGLTRDIGLEGENALLGINNQIGSLTDQEAGAVANARQAIAQNQAQSQNSAVQNAMALMQFLEGQRQFNVGRQATPLNPLQQAQLQILQKQAAPKRSLADLMAEVGL